MTLLKEKKYDVDEAAIQQYFPTEHVVKEMMRIYEEIFGLVFKEYVCVFVFCVLLFQCDECCDVLSVDCDVKTVMSCDVLSVECDNSDNNDNNNDNTDGLTTPESTTTTSGSTRSRPTASTTPTAPCRASSSSISSPARASTRTPVSRTSNPPPSSTANTTSAFHRRFIRSCLLLR